MLIHEFIHVSNWGNWYVERRSWRRERMCESVKLPRRLGSRRHAVFPISGGEGGEQQSVLAIPRFDAS